VSELGILFRTDSPELTIRSAKDPKKLASVTETGRQTTLTLAAAHALVLLDDGTVVGDPMEKTTLSALDWKLSKGA
jgi:cation-transporting ATPase 13A1